MKATNGVANLRLDRLDTFKQKHFQEVLCMLDKENFLVCHEKCHCVL